MARKADMRIWAKNIAENYNKDVDTNILSQLIDACNDLKIDFQKVDKRWQFFIPGDHIIFKDIMYLLTGI